MLSLLIISDQIYNYHNKVVYMFLRLMCTVAKTRALMDNIIDVQLDVVECEENIQEITDRVELQNILRCYDLEVLESTIDDLKKKGLLK